jgi:hypothetical protein
MGGRRNTMKASVQRALDLYDLRTVGSSQDRRDCLDRLMGLLARMNEEELSAYYGELMRRRAAEKVEGDEPSY